MHNGLDVKRLMSQECEMLDVECTKAMMGLWMLDESGV